MAPVPYSLSDFTQHFWNPGEIASGTENTLRVTDDPGAIYSFTTGSNAARIHGTTLSLHAVLCDNDRQGE